MLYEHPTRVLWFYFWLMMWNGSKMFVFKYSWKTPKMCLNSERLLKVLERLVHYSSPYGTIVQLLTIIMWCGSCVMLFPLLAKSHPSPDQCVCQETMRDQLCHTDYCRQTVSVPTRLHTLETRALYSATTYYAQIERINQQNQSKP